ncbi:MAG: PD40 domain-containing protein, partial [Sedimentisphaerales bacterium]|nr:PD40 domain-containing protein [Sedimentisphaerales bacterium]
DPWGPPANVGPPINTVGEDGLGTLSADGRTLYFGSDRPGGRGSFDMWQAEILPIVDFNGDGNVDGRDLLIMTEHWGTNEQLCDIGPMPWGDSVVDVQDLIVLAECVGKEPDDPTLVAHWALDETEGNVAHDSTGAHDGTIIGMSAWHPAGGVLDGALELDGTTFVAADFVLNPSDGPFSILAWIKAGAPGEVIVSQQAGYDWLSLDPTTGVLMTELRSGGRQSKPLHSDAIITDENWHRVSFTWDGTNRSLYVDDILVAEDTDVALAECYSGLNIGCGAIMTPNTFFTGLIDDVRICRRAIKP